MMIGSKMDDIKGLDQEKPHSSKVSFKEKPSKEPLCQNKVSIIYFFHYVIVLHF